MIGLHCTSEDEVRIMEVSGNTLKINVFILTLIGTWILVLVNRFLFRKIYEVRKLLYLRFFEKILTTVICVAGLFIALSSYGGFETIWKTMLGGTAFASGVLIFAAQDIIKDMLAGLMISIYKPFEIGNRIELENGTAGIVRDINMRHVVLDLQDTQVLVIPNSELNEMSVRNYSYLEEYRSAMFRFYIAYNSDVKKAMRVIREAIIDSGYSIPGKKMDGRSDYAPVYFMAYQESSLMLTTTVYYMPYTPSEVLISDINMRVNQALHDNGIEIPYSYLNVIQKGVQANAGEGSL